MDQSSYTGEEATDSAPSTFQSTIESPDTTYTSRPIGQTDASNSGNDLDVEQSADDNTETYEGGSESNMADSTQQTTIPLARSAPSFGVTAQEEQIAHASSTSRESTEAGEELDSESNQNVHNSEKIIDVTLDFVPRISGCTDVVEVASEIPNLTMLVKIMEVAGVAEDVAGQNKVMTILAPTNEAFGATLKAIGITLDQLLANPTLLKRVTLTAKIMFEKQIKSISNLPLPYRYFPR